MFHLSRLDFCFYGRGQTHRGPLFQMDYPSVIETDENTSAEIILPQSSCVIHEVFAPRQFQRTNDKTLINVAAESNPHLKTTLLNIEDFKGSAL